MTTIFFTHLFKRPGIACTGLPRGGGKAGAAYGKMVCNPKSQNLNIEGHPKEKHQN